MDFVDKMTRINHGRAFYSAPDKLGEYVLVDYVTNRRKGSRRSALAHPALARPALLRRTSTPPVARARAPMTKATQNYDQQGVLRVPRRRLFATATPRGCAWNGAFQWQAYSIGVVGPARVVG